MEKWFCWVSMGVAGVLFVLFLLDAIISIPFNLWEITPVIDIVALLGSGILVYLSWNAYRDLR